MIFYKEILIPKNSSVGKFQDTYEPCKSKHSPSICIIVFYILFYSMLNDYKLFIVKKVHHYRRWIIAPEKMYINFPFVHDKKLCVRFLRLPSIIIPKFLLQTWKFWRRVFTLYNKEKFDIKWVWKYCLHFLLLFQIL